MTAIALEVCVDSIASLNAAVAGGADRVELCSALELGGLTPSASLINAASHCAIPVYAMIRSRAGDFNYSAGEIDLMVDDVQICAGTGLNGVVIGAARSGQLNVAGLEKLCRAAGTMGVTLHRVFDTLSEPLRAIQSAADIGIERILTSGGALAADQGVDQIRRYVDFAGGRLAIMAGGGITTGNARRIVMRTGVREIHGSFGGIDDPTDPAIERFGFSSGPRRTTNANTIRQIRLSLQTA